MPAGTAGPATREASASWQALGTGVQVTVTDASLKYVNRLSDFLFVAGRYVNDRGARDVLWAPGQNR